MAHGMISAPQPEAVEAGALALQRGGNAVDAAITCALVQCVVDPLMCGIAGVGTMQIYMPGKDVHENIGFHGQAPGAARPDMWTGLIEGESRDGFGFRLRGRVNELGYQSVVVPGTLLALWEAADSHALMDWPDLMAPAIEHAKAGRMIRPHGYAYLTQSDASSGRLGNIERMSAFEATKRQFFQDDGQPYTPGQRVPNPALARTLSRIAEGGAETFYAGEIAAEIAEEMARHGGLITQDDLRNASTAHEAPLWGGYRDYRIATSRPSGAGLVLLEMLNILENFDLGAIGHNTPEYLRVLTETIKLGVIDKAASMGDPAFVDIPFKKLTSKEYARELADRIKSGEKAHIERVPLSHESKDTTQVSVIDENGNAVTLSHTLGMPSGVVSESLGFMYNGCMAIFDPRPDRPASIAPGKSYTSNMTPTIVFRGDDPHIVLGSPGATHIALSVMQVILNVVHFGMSISDAVAAPRFSVTSDAIDVCNRIPRFVTDAVAAEGYEVRRNPSSFAYGSVHAVMRAGGVLSGGADPTRDGMVLKI